MPHPVPPRLDAELAWGRDHAPGQPSMPGPGPQGATWAHRLLAPLADIGVLLLAVGLAWVLAALSGASLNPQQIAVGAGLGVLALAPVALACLWVWRGTPGMLLLNLAASRPLPFARAVGVAALWFVCLPLLGLPLSVRWRGLTLLERLAGSRLRSRSPHEDA
ncbi:MAG: hypothetical protein MUF10_11935 [Thermoanaerobaculaceae bacterium]|jgi:hypothetical protein|nr:hypothetical protein [Thermoanaerobaculaceae bacterium]